MYTTLKIQVNGQELHISVKIEVYTKWSLLFNIRNYHSSSDQVHPRNNLFKTSRRIYQVDRLSETIICKYNVLKGSLAVKLSFL